MLGIPAGIDQKDIYAVKWWPCSLLAPGRRHSLSRGRLPWSSLFSRPQRFPCCCSMVDVPVMRACRFSGAAVEKTFVLPQLQLAEKSDSFYGPSYLAVTCSVCRLRSTRFGLSGRFFRNYSCIQHSLVRQWLHVGFSLRGFWKNFTHLSFGGLREMTSCLSPYSALSLVRQRIHAVRQSTRLSGRISGLPRQCRKP